MTINPFKFIYVMLRAKKIRRRGKTLRLKISNVADFFKELNEKNINYIVLRWFDKVPLSRNDELIYSEDIDLFVDENDIYKILGISSKFLGKISCDLYSKSGKMSTTFKRYPYFPPSFGEEILQKKMMFRNAFYIPTPEMHFKTLAFHVVYHKAMLSGLDTGIKTIKNSGLSNSKYLITLKKLAVELGLDFPKDLSLLHLYNWLKKNDWAMPYDLLNRWPIRDEWIEWLENHEEETLKKIHYTNKDKLIALVIREDAKDSMIFTRVIDLIKAHYTIKLTKQLSENEVRKITRNTRGGNWLEHGKKDLIRPFALIVCERIVDHCSNHEHVKLDLRIKEEIRKIINAEYPDKLPRLVLHGSDNYFEALSYISLLENKNE